MDFVVVALMVTGTVFFAAGSVGVLRFPDVYTRLHALTKADNLGLGFIVVALALHSGSPVVAAKLVLTWGLVLMSGATASHLVAEAARKSGVKPWRRT
ncbi:MAG: monovalent cation/H(+) antiporter subunit G [Actinomycetota bacterium]|nr:monovalent cation/H(+) antiporter subunit G [Actinomycetota bacterium]MDZ4178577.1 monovalent cation/H(+) antiporter subunit G [Coriobacteriia bacterium]